MNLFNGYCYADISGAAYAEISLPATVAGFGTSGFVAAPVSFTVLNATDVEMTYRYKPFSITADSTYVMQKTYPTCSIVGVADPTTRDIFTIPLAADMAQMWMIGFGLPIICYLVAWGYGIVINMFSRDHK